MRTRFPVFVLASSFLALAARAQSPCEQWKPGFEVPGFVNSVSDVASFDDGTGTKLYACGWLQLAGEDRVGTLARWDGAHWSTVPGVPLSRVEHLLVFDDGSSFGPALYVAGAGNAPQPGFSAIARWNGSTWDALGGGMNNGTSSCFVSSMFAFDRDGAGPAHADLVVEGQFASVSGVAAFGKAAWNGTSWSALGTGEPDIVLGTVWNASAFGPIVAGAFTQLSNPWLSFVRGWNGTQWVDVPGQFDGTIGTLAAFDAGAGEELFVVGRFGHVGGQPVGPIVRRDAQGWHDATQGITATANQLRFGGAKLLVHDDGSGPALHLSWTEKPVSSLEFVVHVSTWANGAWSDLPGPLAGVGSLDTTSRPGVPGELFALGSALHSRGTVPSTFVRRVGTTWSAMHDHGLGADGPIRALRVLDLPFAPGPALYALGSFRSALGVPGQNLVRWDGVQARAFASPTEFPAAFEAFDDGAGTELFAARNEFLNPGVLRFDGTQWSDAGSSFFDPYDQLVTIAAIDDGAGAGKRLFAAGAFHAGGGVEDRALAVWNGTTWIPFGGDSNGVARSLVEFDDGNGARLYVGGYVEFHPSSSNSFVHRWDGTSWTGLGPALGEVKSLCIFDDGTGEHLYMGGEFYAPWSAPSLDGVAMWDGAQWTQVGSGLPNAIIDRLLVHDFGNGPELVAIGWGVTLGGANDLHVARWNGASWRTLGAGIEASGTTDGFAAASFRGDLWVGGGILTAGGRASANLAVFGCADSVPEFCAGDGVDPQVTTACPCANSGAPFHGCANSVDANGARLKHLGATSNDSATLVASSMPASALAAFVQSDQRDFGGVALGDGVLCLAGSLHRLGVRPSTAGVARFPDVGGASLGALGGNPPGSGVLARYQVVYRNSAAAFCPPSAFNVTNGIQLAW